VVASTMKMKSYPGHQEEKGQSTDIGNNWYRLRTAFRSLGFVHKTLGAAP
jgi:hypothetical protein